MFSGHQILKHRNSDPVRDINFLIDHLKGKTLKSLSESSKMSISSIRCRIYRQLRRIKYLALYYDYEKYKFFYQQKDNVDQVIEVVDDYKKYVIEKLNSNEFYKPFKKDLEPVRLSCEKCNGKGYITYKEQDNVN